MRWSYWACLAAAIAVGCTGDDPTPSSPNNSPDGGPDPIIGQAQDFSFTIAGPTTTTTLVQGGKATITVVVARKPDLDALKLPVAVKVTGPAKITGQTTIPPDATSGDIELTANATSDQGPAKIELTGDASGRASATTTVDAFVRGKAGSIDTTFGSAGVFKGPVNLNLTRRVFALADGKLVYVGPCAGATTAFCVSRVMPDGTLDMSYGNGGGVAKFDGFAYATSIQSDGKVIAASKQQGTTNVLQIFRVLADGTALDPAFGTSGVVTVTLPQGSPSTSVTAAACADGTTVISFNWTRADAITYPALLHLNASGAALGGAQGLTFWSYGTSPPGGNSHVGCRATGQVFVYGNVPTSKMGFAQIMPTGTLDGAWGTSGGFSVFDTAWQASIGLGASIIEQSTHKLLALGYSTDVTNASIVSRITANASAVDNGFGNNGISQRLVGSPIQMVLDASDRPLVLAAENSAWYIYRLTTDGAPDLTFGDAGKVSLTSPLGSMTSLAVQPDGRIVALGYNGDPYNPPESPFLVRFWP